MLYISFCFGFYITLDCLVVAGSSSRHSVCRQPCEDACTWPISLCIWRIANALETALTRGMGVTFSLKCSRWRSTSNNWVINYIRHCHFDLNRYSDHSGVVSLAPRIFSLGAGFTASEIEAAAFVRGLRPAYGTRASWARFLIKLIDELVDDN